MKKKTPFFLRAIYYVGGGIALLGTIILISQNWRDFDLFMKMFTTTGFGMILYTVALLLNSDKRTGGISSPLFLMSGFLIPAGLMIALDHYNFDVSDGVLQAVFSSIVAASYLLSYFLIRRNVFIILTVAFFTWTFFALVKLLVLDIGLLGVDSLYLYCQLISGITYIFIAWLFSWRKTLSNLSGVMYILGTIGILSSILLMDSEGQFFWHMIFPIVCGGLMWLAVQVRRSAVFVISAISIIPFILKVTYEYFPDDLNWPLVIIGAGLLVIAIGYAIFMANQTYFKK